MIQPLPSDNMVSWCENSDGWDVCDVIILLLPFVLRALVGQS